MSEISPAAAVTPVDTVDRRAPFMAFTAFMAQNTATGLCYGSFGVLVLEFEQRTAVGRAQISIAFSLVVLTTGLLAPIIGSLLGRVSIRAVMVAGALLSACGFAGLAHSSSFLAMLGCFGLLIGPGVSLLGNIPAITLVNNWYTRRQGLVLGLVMMPVAITLVPLVVVNLLPTLGLERILWLIATGYLVILPLLLFVSDGPEDLDSATSGPRADALASATTRKVTPMLYEIIGNPAFLPLILATGLVVGAGISKNTHLVPLIVENHWSLKQATLLLAISGGSAMVGSLLHGVLADRFNASRVLMGNALLQAVVWFILVAPVSYPLLVVDAVLIGICLGGFLTAKAVVVVRIYGRQRFAAVSGLTSLTTLPFLFGLSPLVGVLREHTGSYRVPISFLIGGLIIAAICMAFVSRRERHQALAPG
ncbi:MFS transporter [Parahaliea maris]|uniref:MFS transporter n=1 Tax=Parahaliea maris TaxID=2716870 RepID=A0A5C8ZMV2_9GAMM|nr:MFS transporter [Parahaliea maris]TXS89823.1 MFS transporter [Parahaliea maris]